ncbi:MAG: hypothetical protein V1875_00675 [Candidatus Altiarchaeota archaeon]
MKGYLFTTLTVLMFLSLFMMTYYFSGKSVSIARSDIKAAKTATMFDDAAGDVAGIQDLKASVEKTGGQTKVSFFDRVPAAWDIPAAAAGYAKFVNSTYSAESGSQLALDCGNLTDPSAELGHPVYPLNYSWGWGNSSKRTLWFRNMSTGYGLAEFNLILGFGDDSISDFIWLEAEDFLADGGTATDEADASEGTYMSDFSLLQRVVDVPLPLNYTLWVRVYNDNASKNFTVEIGGVNSTRFDLRDWEATGPYYRWFNDTLVVFNMTAGQKTVKIIPDPSSGTESVDVVLLSTRYLDPPNEPPISPPPDPFEMQNTSSGGLALGIRAEFANANYTFTTSKASVSARTGWNITFDDGDWIRIVFGQEPTPGSMLLEINNETNSSRGTVNATATFPFDAEPVYAGSGCSLRKDDPIMRTSELWLARG